MKHDWVKVSNSFSASLFLGSSDTAQTLNAAELYIGGVADVNQLTSLPADARSSLRGCFEAPRFISYSITQEPPPQWSFDTQKKNERFVLFPSLFLTLLVIDFRQGHFFDIL